MSGTAKRLWAINAPTKLAQAITSTVSINLARSTTALNIKKLLRTSKLAKTKMVLRRWVRSSGCIFIAEKPLAVIKRLILLSHVSDGNHGW